jgi:Uma2 family endonuclease
MAATMAQLLTTVTPRRFTVEEFYHMAEVGILAEDERVELVEGEIVEMAAIGINHSNAVSAVTIALVPVVGPTVRLHVQNPIRLGRRGGFQPDVALVRRHRLGSHPHPEDILLLVEVADSSLEYDRDTKFPLYATAGIAESWLVNLRAWTIERHTEPRDGRYASIAVAGRGEALSSTILPAVILAVDEVFAAVEAPGRKK